VGKPSEIHLTKMLPSRRLAGAEVDEEDPEGVTVSEIFTVLRNVERSLEPFRRCRKMTSRFCFLLAQPIWMAMG
jgi:hypothetical protein